MRFSPVCFGFEPGYVLFFYAFFFLLNTRILFFLYFFSILKGLFSLTGTVSTSPNLAKARARRASKTEPPSVCAMLLFSSVIYMLFSVVYMLFSVVYMLLHIVQSLTLYGIRTISAYPQTKVDLCGQKCKKVKLNPHGPKCIKVTR